MASSTDGNTFAASKAEPGSTEPTPAEREALVKETQGPPAAGGSITKKGEVDLGFSQIKTRDQVAKKSRTNALIPKGDVYATLYLIPDKGAQSTFSFTTDKFLLTGVVTRKAERFQIVETFQKSLIYFMDKGPEIYQYSGILFNADVANADGQLTSEPNWRDSFIQAYESHLRGTRCVEEQVRVFLDYDGMLVTGYMLNSAVSQTADMLNMVSFSFDLFITGVKFFGRG